MIVGAGFAEETDRPIWLGFHRQHRLDMYAQACADWCAQALPTREVYRESPLVDKKRTNGADRCWASV